MMWLGGAKYAAHYYAVSCILFSGFRTLDSGIDSLHHTPHQLPVLKYVHIISNATLSYSSCQYQLLTWEFIGDSSHNT